MRGGGNSGDTETADAALDTGVAMFHRGFPRHAVQRAIQRIVDDRAEDFLRLYPEYARWTDRFLRPAVNRIVSDVSDYAQQQWPQQERSVDTPPSHETLAMMDKHGACQQQQQPPAPPPSPDSDAADER